MNAREQPDNEGGNQAPVSRRGTFAYRDDIAVSDVAFDAFGKTREELFRAAADALLTAMVDTPDAVRDRVTRHLECHHAELDLLLYKLLQELVYYKDAENLLLRIGDLSVCEENGELFLQTRATGETFDPARHDMLVDVKAVTLYKLAARQTETGWQATVVLDV